MMAGRHAKRQPVVTEVLWCVQLGTAQFMILASYREHQRCKQIPLQICVTLT